MKKKLIGKILLTFCFFWLCLLGFYINRSLREAESLKKEQAFISYNGMEFLSTSPSPNRKTLLSLFHPSCDFCSKDAELFYDRRTYLEDIEIVWISYDDRVSIKNFSQIHGLDTLPNVHFTYLDIEAMLERYGNVKFPTFLTYDENGELLKKFVGLTEPETLIAVYANEHW